MKLAFTPLIFLAFALTGCMDAIFESNPPSAQNSDSAQATQNSPAANVASEPNSQTIANDGLPGQPATAPSTAAQLPIEQSLTGDLDTTALINGDSLESGISFWMCENSAPQEQLAPPMNGTTTALAFMADGSGFLGDLDSQARVSWFASGSYIEIVIAGQYVGRFDDVVTGGPGSLTMSYVLSDGNSGTLTCVMRDLTRPQ